MLWIFDRPLEFSPIKSKVANVCSLYCFSAFVVNFILTDWCFALRLLLRLRNSSQGHLARMRFLLSYLRHQDVGGWRPMLMFLYWHTWLRKILHLQRVFQRQLIGILFRTLFTFRSCKLKFLFQLRSWSEHLSCFLSFGQWFDCVNLRIEIRNRLKRFGIEVVHVIINLNKLITTIFS